MKINKIQLANPVWSFLFETSKMGIGVITGIFEFVLMSEKGGGSVYHVGSGGDDGEVGEGNVWSVGKNVTVT